MGKQKSIHSCQAIPGFKRARAAVVALAGFATLAKIISDSLQSRSFQDIAQELWLRKELSRVGEKGVTVLKTNGFKTCDNERGPGSDIFVQGSPTLNQVGHHCHRHNERRRRNERRCRRCRCRRRCRRRRRRHHHHQRPASVPRHSVCTHSPIARCPLFSLQALDQLLAKQRVQVTKTVGMGSAWIFVRTDRKCERRRREQRRLDRFVSFTTSPVQHPGVFSTHASCIT